MTRSEYEVKLNEIKNLIEEAKTNENDFLALMLISNYKSLRRRMEIDLVYQQLEAAFEEYKNKVEL